MPKDPGKEKERKRIYEILNRDARNARKRERYRKEAQYREANIKRVKTYRENNIERVRKRERDKKRSNRPKIRTYRNEKYNTDPNFKLAQVLRVRIRKFIFMKSERTMELVGGDLRTVRRHLTKLFKKGMNWSNHGNKGWHIDHIVPCAAFDLTLPEERKKCFNYKNLQPLWWWENLEKSSKLNQ